MDTVYYNYGAGRGGDLNSDGIDFDDCTSLRYYLPASSLIPAERRFKIYNTSNKLISETIEVYHIPSSSWNESRRFLYNYNALGNIISTEEQEWKGVWQGLYLNKYSYSSSNLISGHIRSVWNSAGSWKFSTKDTGIFDAKDNQIQYQTWKWDDAGNKWDNDSRQNKNFNSSNDMIGSIEEKWNFSTNSWQADSKIEMLYDANHNPLITQKYFSEHGLWTLYEYQERAYNSSGDWITSYRKELNPSTGIWDNYYRAFLEFDGTGRMTMFKSNFSKDGSNWENIDSSHTVYDSFYESSQRIKYKWNKTVGAFDQFSKENSTYNKYSQQTSLTYYYWDATGSYWKSPEFHNNYYYEEFTAAVPDINNEVEELILFPVPANSELNYDLVWAKPQEFEISLTNLSGTLLKIWHRQVTTHSAEIIPLAEFPAGIYVITFHGEGNRKISRSFIISR